MRTEKEIKEMADRATAAADDPTHGSMTYEEGLRDALAWVLGEIEDGKELF